MELHPRLGLGTIMLKTNLTKACVLSFGMGIGRC